jgi:MFS transporter, DHA3 family, macrolide efflux protein
MSTVAIAAASPCASPSSRLLNRNFVLFWQAQLVSQFGNQAFLIAMMAWTAETTHSATMSGLMMMAGILPIVLLGPVTGAFADSQRSRVRIIMTCDLLAGSFVVLLALGFLFGAPAWRPYMLFATALLLGVCQAFFDPAVNAFIPDMVPREEIEAANAFRQSSRQVTVLTAQGLGGILYALAGPAALFLINGASFLFAGASEAYIRPPAAGANGARSNAPRPRFADQIADGFRYVAAQPGMVAFLITGSVFNALLMPVSALLPVYATDHLHSDVRWYGFLLAAIGVGALSGASLVGAMRLKLTGSSRRWVLMGAFATLAASLMLLGQIRSPWIALGVMALTGVMSGTINVLVVSIIQRRTSVEFRGRVLGLHATMTRVLIPIGLVGGGAIADFTGRNIPVVYGVCGALALATVACLAVRRNTRAFLLAD